MRTFTRCLAAFLLVIMATQSVAAKAGQLSFFSTYPRFDLEHWRLSDGWTNGDHQSCEWKAGALSAVNGNLELRRSDEGGKLRPFSCLESQCPSLPRYGRYEARMRTAARTGLN